MIYGWGWNFSPNIDLKPIIFKFACALRVFHVTNLSISDVCQSIYLCFIIFGFQNLPTNVPKKFWNHEFTQFMEKYNQISSFLTVILVPNKIWNYLIFSENTFWKKKKKIIVQIFNLWATIKFFSSLIFLYAQRKIHP